MQIQIHLLRELLYRFVGWTTGLVQTPILTLTNAESVKKFIGEQACFPFFLFYKKTN